MTAKADLKPILSGPSTVSRPTKEQAQGAVRTLLEYIGEDPDREGLVDTPSRLVKAWNELFSGYTMDAAEVLGRTFEEVSGYDDMVLLRDIAFFSHCEHHIVPIIGKAHIAYVPDDRVVGLSKLARMVEIFAKRLQTQEAMTAQIADTLHETLKPKGVAVMIEAQHMCMVMRGVRKENAMTVTTRFHGSFQDNPSEQANFLAMMPAKQQA